jgi:hypothetical protein
MHQIRLGGFMVDYQVHIEPIEDIELGFKPVWIGTKIVGLLLFSDSTLRSKIGSAFCVGILYLSGHFRPIFLGSMVSQL